MPVTFNSRSITATSDGLTTGQITFEDGGGFVSVTSGNSAHIITLPNSDDLPISWVVEGWLGGATACEMQTVASSGQTINGLDGDGTNSLAIPATQYFRVVHVAADTFIVHTLTELGAAVTNTAD
jgi:hypothetical protein